MGKFVVTSPDGVQYEVDAPEGATEQQAIDYVKSNYAPQVAKPGPTLGAQLERQAGLAGRAVIEGASAPVNMVANALSGAYNLGANLLGSESRMPYMSQGQSKALTQLGVPEPETTMERTAQAGMQGLVSAGQMANIAPKVLGADLVRQLPAAAAAPMAAQPVAEKTKEITGSDLAATLAGIGVAGAAGKIAGDAMGWLSSGKQQPMTMAEVQQRAQRAYTKVSDAGIELNQQNANDLVSKVKTRLDAVDYLPENAQPVANILKRFESIAERGNVSFNDVDQMRRLANGLKGNADKNIRRFGSEMVDSIDSHIAALSPKNVTAGAGGIDEAVKTIVSARKDWRNLSRASTLENVLDAAEVRALNPTASESELIRKGFINLAANKEKMRLFTENEQNAIKAVAKGSSLDNLLTVMGKFNPQRNQIVTGGTVVGGIASPETLKYTAPLAIVGYGADKLQGVMRRRAAQRTVGGLLSGETPPQPPSYFTRGLASSLLVPPEPQ